MKKLILLEYFTSQSSILKSKDKEIFREALSLSDSIIRNFIKSRDIKKIYVIRNKNLKTIESKKVKTYFTNPETSYTDILKRFKKKIILLCSKNHGFRNMIKLQIYEFFNTLGAYAVCNIPAYNDLAYDTDQILPIYKKVK